MIPVLLAFLAAPTLCGEPRLEARRLAVHEADIVPISVQLGYVTQIYLPKKEEIMPPAHVGLKEFFDVTASGNVLYVKPLDISDGREGGKKTNIDIDMASGNHMTFIVQEISREKNAHADLKVFVEEADHSSLVAMDAPQFVAVTQLDQLKRELAQQREQLELEKNRSQERMQTATDQALANFDFNCYELYDKKGRENFHAAVGRDKKFTLIQVDTQESPSVWEMRDGKLSKVDAVFRDGKYTVQHLMEEGELRAGKSSIKFRFVGKS